MTNKFWTDEDFNVFNIEGLENRMSALQSIIQPKFHKLGERYSDLLSAHGTGEFFPHVARHARRTVNPPTDSWVAFAPAKRGYKALPHFQIGLWETHLFIIIAVIYENPNKQTISERFSKNLHSLTNLGADYIISGDHMKPDAQLISEVGKDGITKVLDRLYNVKKAELLIGRHLKREDAIKMSKSEFIEYADDTFSELLPIYDVIIGNN